jgi:peptidoglycan/xylan/chitin deacetylase (PgdA/CDA1 family)
MVSRYEEVVTPVADRFGRFPASASLAHREGFLHRAIVNEYFDLLWYWISSLQPTLRKKPLWPNGKGFAACITHDVDFFRKYHFPSSILIIGREAVRYRRVSEALRLAVGWVKVLARKERDPFDTFNYMVQMERQYGLTSSFYFKCGGNSPHDSRDTIKRAKVAALARDLEGRGCEIGLHSSHEAYDSYELMSAEKATLDLVIGHRSYGCRQHFMRFKVPDTWLLQEQLGFLYDTTMAFADHVGFRCGFCLPLRPFDLLSNRVVNLWELPLTVMEGSLQNKDHQNLRPEEAYNQIVDLIETVKTHSGLFVLLWHNSSLEATGQWAGWKAIYEKTMEYISQQSVLVASPERALESYQAASVGHFQQGSEPRK